MDFSTGTNQWNYTMRGYFKVASYICVFVFSNHISVCYASVSLCVCMCVVECACVCVCECVFVCCICTFVYVF